jgi:hypothetical protein
MVCECTGVSQIHHACRDDVHLAQFDHAVKEGRVYEIASRWNVQDNVKQD